jgi:hypothetical protein
MSDKNGDEKWRVRYESLREKHQVCRDWRRRYKSLRRAHEILEQEHAKTQLALELAEARNKNAQSNVETRKLININALSGFNEKEQMYVRKITALRNALKETGYSGDIDSLGD